MTTVIWNDRSRVNFLTPHCTPLQHAATQCNTLHVPQTHSHETLLLYTDQWHQMSLISPLVSHQFVKHQVVSHPSILRVCRNTGLSVLEYRADMQDFRAHLTGYRAHLRETVIMWTTEREKLYLLPWRNCTDFWCRITLFETPHGV